MIGSENSMLNSPRSRAETKTDLVYKKTYNFHESVKRNSTRNFHYNRLRNRFGRNRICLLLVFFQLFRIKTSHSGSRYWRDFPVCDSNFLLFSSFPWLWLLLANCRCVVTAVGVVWGDFKCVIFRFPLVQAIEGKCDVKKISWTALGQSVLPIDAYNTYLVIPYTYSWYSRKMLQDGFR